MIRNKRFSRRTFLGGLASAAALAPFVPVLESEAGQSALPKRLILLCCSPNWWSRGIISSPEVAGMRF